MVLDVDQAVLASEVDRLLERADRGPERRGLLRAMTLEGQGEPGAELWFVGD